MFLKFQQKINYLTLVFKKNVFIFKGYFYPIKIFQDRKVGR